MKVGRVGSLRTLEGKGRQLLKRYNFRKKWEYREEFCYFVLLTFILEQKNATHVFNVEEKSNEERKNFKDIRERADRIRDMIEEELGGLGWLIQIEEFASEKIMKEPPLHREGRSTGLERYRAFRSGGRGEKFMSCSFSP